MHVYVGMETLGFFGRISGTVKCRKGFSQDP